MRRTSLDLQSFNLRLTVHNCLVGHELRVCHIQVRVREDGCFEADKLILGLADGLEFVQSVAVEDVDCPVRSNGD